MTLCAFGIFFTRMILSDPGRVNNYVLEQQGQAAEDCSSSDNSLISDGQGRRHWNSRAYDNVLRGKYCIYCVSFIERYDHHCAAIQNCIGLKNTGSFLLLLATSCAVQMLYLQCFYLYFKRVAILSARMYLRDSNGISFENSLGLAWELLSKEAWVLSITLFVGLQILWQVPFLVFQLYLIGRNLTTDEWINWEKIPSFYKETTILSEHSCDSKAFFNPHDKGLYSSTVLFLLSYTRIGPLQFNL
ncbi:hypothetical protein L7F22_000124 [Adiantum nelumboides]|nr:hypothetical protein [Adiantum nelumboides]